MRYAKLALLTLLGASVTGALAPAPGQAQEDDAGFGGTIRIGYRSVDPGGSERKFREDVNQEDGPILFDFDVSLVPEGDLRGFADQIEVDLNDVGAEAFETFHFGIQKYGGYDFEYDRRESAYFYADFLGFTDPAHLDPRTFDFRRVRDTASLELDLSPRAELTFGFEQYTKRGEGTISLDVSRDEFELDSVIDEEQQTSSIGFSYAWDRVTLVLEERLREYDNTVEWFLPGFSEGLEEGPATLDFFFLNQPYDLEGNQHSVKVLARPMDRLDIRISADLHETDVNLEADERSRGISFSGAPLSTDLVGDGDIQRDVDLYDVEATYLLNDNWAILGEVRLTDLSQRGDFLFGDVLRSGDWDIETSSYKAGLQYAPTGDVTVAGGLLIESRDVFFEWSEEGADSHTEDVTTDSDGYFAMASWRPATGLELTGEADLNSVDDPFTRISPTDRARYRVRAKYRWGTGLFLSGSYQLKDYENDGSGWLADSSTAVARVGYYADGLDVSLGYSILDTEREIDAEVTGGSRTVVFPIFYEVDADWIDGRVRWAATDRVAVGGSFNLYDNGGSFGMEYEDFRAFVEVGFLEDYIAGLAYRTVDYDEADFEFDDYDADIVEVSIGYRW